MIHNTMGTVRDTIDAARERKHWTVYKLWLEARAFDPKLSQAQVGEFLKGTRDVRVSTAEAMMQALNIKLPTGRKR